MCRLSLSLLFRFGFFFSSCDTSLSELFFWLVMLYIYQIDCLIAFRHAKFQPSYKPLAVFKREVRDINIDRPCLSTQRGSLWGKESRARFSGWSIPLVKPTLKGSLVLS